MRLLTLILTGAIMGQATASEIPVQMLTREDVQRAADPSVLEGVSTEPAGTIYFPDRILAAQVDDLKGDAAAQLESWSRTHRFLIVPFSIGVRPSGDLIPERVDVALSLAEPQDLALQPIVIDVFPPNGFKKAAFQGSAGLEIGAGGSFQGAATAKANAAFNYTYAPAYANVFSGFGSTHAFWQFNRAQDSYPIGNIPLKLLVVVPRKLQEPELIGDFDVAVNFGGSFWSGDSVRAQFTTLVSLPEEP